MRRALLALVTLLGGCQGSKPDAEQRALGVELARMTREVEGARPARAIPRGAAPTAPAFGPAFGAKAAERAKLHEEAEAAQRCLTGLVDGAGSADACAEGLRPSDAAFAVLLDTGASTAPGAPLGLRALDAAFPGRAQTDVGRSLVALAKHGAARVALHVARREPAAGALVCVRTLEVLRDAATGSNLVGAMMVATGVKVVAAPCERALATSPREVASARRADVAAVRTTMPALAWFADAETASVHLANCGWTIPPEERASLSDDARAILAKSDVERAGYGWGERRTSWRLCRDNFAAMTAMARSYHAPKGSPERRRLAEPSGDHGEDGVAIASLDRYEQEWDGMLDLLATLAKE